MRWLPRSAKRARHPHPNGALAANYGQHVVTDTIVTRTLIPSGGTHGATA